MLGEALQRLESHLQDRGAVVVAHARPGLAPDRLQEVLQPLGLEPSHALREWFGWHDGAGEPGRTPSREVEVAPGCELLSAEQLVSRYEEGSWVVGADGLVDGETLDFPDIDVRPVSEDVLVGDRPLAPTRTSSDIWRGGGG